MNITKTEFKHLYRTYRMAQKAYNNGDKTLINCYFNLGNHRAMYEKLVKVQDCYCKARYDNNAYVAVSRNYIFFQFSKGAV